MQLPVHLKGYTKDLRNYDAWCRAHDLDPMTVKRAHLDLYVRWMQAQGRWAESTVSRRIGTVCGMYRYATMEDYLPKDPSVAVARPTVDRDKQRRTWLNPVQFAQVLKAAQSAGPTEAALGADLKVLACQGAAGRQQRVDRPSTRSAVRVGFRGSRGQAP